MNGYSNKFTDKYVFKFMNKLYMKRHVVFTVSQKQLYIVLYYSYKTALFKTGLAKSLDKRRLLVKLESLLRSRTV